MLPEKLQAARTRLLHTHPYLAAAVLALRPVEVPGLGSMAVDQFWRLYYDPAVCQSWSVEEIAGVLYHEVAHLLRDHAHRCQGRDLEVWNLAADGEINDDLLREGITLPSNPVTPQTLGQPTGLLAEEYYEALMAALQEAAQGQGQGQNQNGQTQNQSQNQGQGDPSQGDGDASQDGDSGQGSASDTDPEGSGGSGQDAQDSSQGEASSEGEGSSDAAGSASDSSSGGRGRAQSPASHQSQSQGQGSGDGSQSSQGQKDGSGSEGMPRPMPGSGRSGSCATGVREAWELPDPEGEDGVGRAEADLIRREVARAIQEHERSRGTVPGSWRRWAEKVLSPRIPWRQVLRQAVRAAVASVAEAHDYSYARPSRRPNPDFVLPSLRRPLPEVAVVVDTSGSVSDRMLSQAVAEVLGVVRALGGREVTVIAADAQVQTVRRVRSARDLELQGGGGTELGVAIFHAERLRPRPEVLIVVSDGDTPWPTRPPRGMRVVFVITDEYFARHTPSWGQTIHLEL